VLFTGGKGGVGKTTLAANLAVSLAASGARTLLADLDLGLANADVLLGLTAARNVEHALAGECALSECVVAGPAGLRVLPAGSGTADMARMDAAARARFLEGLSELSRGYEVVVGDSAAGIGPDVLAFAAAAQVVIVVTTPDPAALTDAYGLIKALESAAAEHGVEIATPELFLNLVAGCDEAERTASSLAQVCERYLARSPRLAGWLPRSPRVQEACRRQVPFALARGKAPTPEQEALGRLARRVARLCGSRDGAIPSAQPWSRR
jgi:flagellar biosynthesis protein FlhG